MNSEYILRIWYEKNNLLKYTSHRDLINIIYFSILRAKLPVCYTEGFTKKPKLTFSPAMPLGVSSKCEFFDVYIKNKIPIDDNSLILNINSSFPNGINITKIEYVSEDINKFISKILAFKYNILIEPIDTFPKDFYTFFYEQLDFLKNQKEILISYNDKLKDIKPYILEINYKSYDDKIEFKITTQLINNSSIKVSIIPEFIISKFHCKLKFIMDIVKEEIILKS